jgi:hypothetical protein
MTAYKETHPHKPEQGSSAMRNLPYLLLYSTGGKYLIIEEYFLLGYDAV